MKQLGKKLFGILKTMLLPVLVYLLFGLLSGGRTFNERAVLTALRTTVQPSIICYALQGALQGLIEQGCDGPCKDALNMLQKHLNKTAHRPDL